MSINQNPILEVKNLSVKLDGKVLLHDISLEVNEGEVLTIIGPNGAGKTIFFRALLGLLPHGGEILWRPGIKIGYVPQKFAPDHSVPITVKEFLLLKSPRFWAPSKESLDHLNHELRLVGLSTAVLPKPLYEISGGELQRILIAWAMLNHPDVLLFDEPTTGIDIGFEEKIYSLLRRLQNERGTTILLISHDLNVVYRYASSVLCLNKEMVCHGSPQQVLTPQELAKLYGEGGFYHHVSTKPH